MFHLEQALEFDHSAEHVWPYLIAFERVPLWETGVEEIRVVTPGPPAIGSEVVARRRFGGRTTILAGTITAFDEGRSATVVLRGGPLALVTAEYAVEPIVGDRDRSIVTYSGHGALAGPMRVLHPLIGWIGRRQARRNLEALRARIDAGIPPTSPALPGGRD